MRQDTRGHVGPYLLDLRCVVIGQYAMGRSLMDRSILTLRKLPGVIRDKVYTVSTNRLGNSGWGFPSDLCISCPCSGYISSYIGGWKWTCGNKPITWLKALDVFGNCQRTVFGVSTWCILTYAKNNKPCRCGTRCQNIGIEMPPGTGQSR